MSKNRYKEQVWVLPEDDANRQIAQGFTLETPFNRGEIDRMMPRIRPILFGR